MKAEIYRRKGSREDSSKKNHDNIHEVPRGQPGNSTSMVRARPPNRALKRDKILALAKVNLSIYR